MQRVFKQSFIVSVTTAIALLFVGCEESKVAQCSKVIKLANQASTLGQEFGKNPNSANSKGLTELASKINPLAKEMKALEIKDGNLQDFQMRFFTFYQNISNELNNAAIAIEKNNLPATQRFLVSLTRSSTEENSIVNEINSYCSDK
ncbi:hypothetical protein [Nostoc sp. FACHB-888]|uniref:hypothetical protein n=1 Tax=Nostoc sp. FACHB-888 TaxID=2692842 RepID=UPI00168584D6|nr:hypothetical protein [Nostoc sp. FACHB-888]MBD2245680.1 hypothetical protein [Nostoc sp. FACHB-888]MCC5649000.1 hypothetical protein [Nostoc sp. XA013]